MIMDPPEAPTEGINSKASKTAGQIFLMNIRLKDCFLVSCRQTISQLLFITRSLIASHFLSELIPLTFQLRTDQVLVDIDKAKRLKEAKPYITRY